MRAIVLSMPLAISACIGIDATAGVGANGAGSIDLRYEVSRIVAPIASLEGTRGMVPLPLSVADYESAVAGIQGMRIDSVSREEGADKILIHAVLAFENLASLSSFLDPSGRRAIYSEADGRSTLRLVLAEGTRNGVALDSESEKLVKAAFSEYSVSIAIDLPRNVLSSSLSSGTGATARARRAILSMATSALLESAQPVIWEIQW
jgi:hypothetical protein